jgi:hypothetical protein
VDLEAGTIEIRQALKRLPDGAMVVGPPKVDSYRNLRLPNEVVDALRAHRQSQRKKELAAPVWDNPDGGSQDHVRSTEQMSERKRAKAAAQQALAIGRDSKNNDTSANLDPQIALPRSVER